MTILSPQPIQGQRLPDHTQLPETDGSIVQNFQEHPQAMLLCDTIRPVLHRIHPDGQYAIGQDSGIYWRLTNPPLDGCKAPDWFYIPGVPPLLNGQVRRSYVMWQEHSIPVLLIEFVSGNGAEERDTTPNTGKFWVYERGIRAEYYAIYEGDPGRVELYRLVNQQYQRVPPNRRDHFPIDPLGVELGIWQGLWENLDLPWLRFWDDNGLLLLTSEEKNETYRQQIDDERRRADDERRRADQLAERLRQLGIDPDSIP
jgi:Uma2 family endonuclease